MAYTQVEIYTCDSCDIEEEVHEDSYFGMPDGWFNIVRRFDPPIDEDIDPDRHIVSREYCSEECLLDAIEDGELDREDHE